jgi:hypothetical protein
MRKPPTGELCAGEPHAQFGGRGGETLSDPYQLAIVGKGSPHVYPLYSALGESGQRPMSDHDRFQHVIWRARRHKAREAEARLG